VDGANLVSGSVIDVDLMTEGRESGLDEKDWLVPLIIYIIGICPGKHPLFNQ
jgi:hypothetical protein